VYIKSTRTWTTNGRNLGVVRIENRSAVLRLIHQQRHPISRREIAQRTGLDASTITHIVSEFIAVGLIRQCGAVEPNGRTRRGRREIGLQIVPTGVYAVGVHIGIRSIRVAACDLRGEIVGRRASLHDVADPAELVLESTAELVDDLLAKSAVDRMRVVGVGIGAIAFLDPQAGVIHAAPSLGWGEVDVAAPLAQRLGIPVHLDHHVRTMALAEQWFGHARAVPTFALLNVDSSVGFGTVVGGKLMQGDHWRAGQIAHMVVREDGPQCACGRRGCLVMVASYRAIALRAREAVQNHSDSRLAHSIGERPDVPAEYVVFDLARERDPLAESILEEIADHVSVAISYLISILDPQLIVLSAAGEKHAECLLGPVQRKVLARAPLNYASAPRIVASALGRDLAVLGGAALALDHFMAAPLRLPTNSKLDLAELAGD
jgi:predicted NBD/HSP70 family sugar kinase